MTASKEMFSTQDVADLLNKVKGHSSIAKLAAQTPIAFNGNKYFTFSMDSDVSVLGENEAKVAGGVTVAPVTIVPIKFEYGARVSNEFIYGSDEIGLQILAAFRTGFANKIAKGLDIAAFHGINPKTGAAASTVIPTNYFDNLVTTTSAFDAAKVDKSLDDAYAVALAADADVTGMALSRSYANLLSELTTTDGIRLYPELRFGGNPAAIQGVPSDVNSTVEKALAGASAVDYAIIGDFANAFKWGYSKEIPLEVIEFGCPDNDTTAGDLKGHNQVYLRSEMFIGWGILDPKAFVRMTKANA